MKLTEIRNIAERDLQDFLNRLAQEIALILSRAKGDPRRLAEARKRVSALVEQQIGSDNSPFYALLLYWLLYTAYQVAVNQAEHVIGYPTGDIRIDRLFDTPESWIDPNDMQLADRLQHAAMRIRLKLDSAILFMINRVDPVEIPDRIKKLWRTTASNDREPVLGFDLWRLLRHEMGYVWGITILTALKYNPRMRGVDWALSPRHPKMDHCDEVATIGMHGERLQEPYPFEQVPRYPDHVFCLCDLRSSWIKLADGVQIPSVFMNPAQLVSVITGHNALPQTILNSWRR